MPVWKVLLVVVLGFSCLSLALATIVVPFSMTGGSDKWLWLGGLLGATIALSTMFTLFLRHADKTYR